MSKKQNIQKTGGQFLLNPISDTSIFSREDFTNEHSEIYKMVIDFDKDRVLSQKEKIEKYDPDLSIELLKELGELGLLGIDIPEKYDGIDLDKITTAIVAEALVQSPSFAVTWAVQTGIGSLPIIWFGTDEQKNKYLPKVSSGELVCAYGLTEPSSGSDATQAKTSAKLTEDKKHYILNGEKVFITNGGIADVFIVFAQVDGNKFSAFIVEKGTEGFSIGREENKLGMKGSSTAQLIFQDAKVPAENLLYKVGKGATIAFNCLNIGRFKLGCSCLGGSKQAITTASQYSLDRKAFGTTISKFDAIQKKIAEMSILTFATDSMIYRTIGLLQDEIDLIDKDTPDYYIQMGEAMGKYAIETSMVKVFGSDCSHWVIDQGLQVLGGYGYLEEYSLAPAYRDDRINQIWEGTNEINRQIITGFMMKKALTEELPFRDSIRNIDFFLNEKPSSNISEFSKEFDSVESAKKLALYLFNESLIAFGQDLKNEHQVMEMLADIFTDIYSAESAIIRTKKIMDSDNPIPTTKDISIVFISEMVGRIITKTHSILNTLYDGSVSEDIIAKVSKFEKRMRLPVNAVQLKRNIAEYVFDQKKYPY
jgi:alkylation response protein AidB-like acyl-CoA dehydrogenase